MPTIITNYKGSGLPKFQKYPPRIFPGSPNNNKEIIIDSLPILHQTINKHFNINSIALHCIIELYNKHNIKVAESLILQLLTIEVDGVKEYNRSADIYCSKRTPADFNALLEDIKHNGIQQFGTIRMRKNTENNVEVILGEGNHRLAIAKRLNIPNLPIRIRYTS